VLLYFLKKKIANAVTFESITAALRKQIENSLLFSPRVSVSMHANDVTQNTWNISIKLYSQIYAVLCKTFSFSFSSLRFGNLNLSTPLRTFSRHGKISLILTERSQHFPYKCVSMFLYLKNQIQLMALAAKESLASQIWSHTLCWDPVRKLMYWAHLKQRGWFEKWVLHVLKEMSG
jgi:hypothetical protein